MFSLGLRTWWRAWTGTSARRQQEIATRLSRREDKAPVRFTLLKSAAIGDTVLLSAVAADLRCLYPDSRICIACGTSNAAAARLILAANEVVALPMSRPDLIRRDLPKLRADVFIDFDSWPRINALVSCLSGSSVTVGFQTEGQYRHYAYDRQVRHDPLLHEVENYRNLVRDVTSWAGGQLVISAAVSLRLPTFPRGRQRGAAVSYAVLHMFSGGSRAHHKEWAEDNWRAVVTHLLALGLTVRMSGGPTERVRNQAFVSSIAHPGLSLATTASLEELLELLQDAELVISVDTGIAHLAAATSTSTLVLHGPTSPHRWGALGKHVRFLKDPQTPWISLGFEKPPHQRQVQLAASDVVAAADEMLQGRHRCRASDGR